VSDVHADRAALFAHLESSQTQPRFWDRVADDVDWTVEGTHALCGRYRSKADFIAATFTRRLHRSPQREPRLAVTGRRH
jgi:uncharacterized protein